MSFVDFASLKEEVSIEDAASLLGLKLKDNGKQKRGPCPACESGGDRALVITPEKNAFYCFAAKQGGDCISLAAHIRECRMKEAAQYLQEQYSTSTSDSTSNSKVPEERRVASEGGERGFKALTYLETDHEALEALGLSPETLEYFQSGYAPRGVLRGRLAIAIHDLTGTLVGYVGRAVKDDQAPVLSFPKGFEPEMYVFNLHRVEGELFTSRDPLDVLLAYENTGEDTMVSFLHRPIANNVVPMTRAG
jgi:DNA primase